MKRDKTAAAEAAAAENDRLLQAEALLREAGFFEQPDGSWEPAEEQ